MSIVRDGNALQITYQVATGATAQGFTIQLFLTERMVLLERGLNLSKECSMTIHRQSCTINIGVGLPSLPIAGIFTLSISGWEESGVTNKVYFQELTLENVTVISNVPSGNSAHAQRTVLTITGKLLAIASIQLIGAY